MRTSVLFFQMEVGAVTPFKWQQGSVPINIDQARVWGLGDPTGRSQTAPNHEQAVHYVGRAAAGSGIKVGAMSEVSGRPEGSSNSEE